MYVLIHVMLYKVTFILIEFIITNIIKIYVYLQLLLTNLIYEFE